MSRVFELMTACLLGGMASGGAAPESWTIWTVAGNGQPGYSGDGGPARLAQLNNPYGLCRGPDGALYICDMGNHAIRKIIPDGIIRTVAGSGRAGYAGDGGLALEARLNEPYEIRFNSRGDMFFVEMRNHIVRQVTEPSGRITTVAGTGRPGYSGDGGPATRAELNQPHSIQFDRQDNLYICDIGNHRIRRIDVNSGRISTFAGTGTQGATPDGSSILGTPLYGPRAIDFDGTGNLWLALREGNAVYKLDLHSQTIHHVAGTGKQGFTGNGGPAKTATLSGPKGLTLGPRGQVYLADTESHTIRMIDPASGRLVLVAGTGAKGDGPDGNPLVCGLSRPHGVFADGEGTVYIGDSETHRVRLLKRTHAD